MNNTSDTPKKKRVTNSEYRRKRQLLEQQALKLYFEENEIKDIAKKLSKPYKLIVRLLNKHKSELNKYPFGSYKHRKRNDKMAEDFLSGIKIKDIAIKYDLAGNRISGILRKLNINVKAFKKKPKPNIRQLKIIRNQQIINEYNQGVAIDELCIKYLLSYTQIRKILRLNNIPWRRRPYTYILRKKKKPDRMIVEET